jgi:ribonucleotide reductase beta subunit family protein with ferritin-like domain
MTYTDGLFEQRLPDRFPKLVSLYEKAKRDFWNESTEIDWDHEIELSPDKRRALAQVLSITYYGERAALALSGQLVAEVRDEEARQALACQVIEEAKHVAAFQRLLRKLDQIHPPSFFAKRLLTDLLTTKGVVHKMVGMHLFVENIALHSFQTLKEHVEDPLVQQVVEYVARDERKHVALGAIYVPPLLDEMSHADALRLQMKQVKWLGLGIGMVKDGYEPARVLDMDLAKAGKRALKHHYELRDSLASHRALIDIPGFDKIIDAIGKWATPG